MIRQLTIALLLITSLSSEVVVSVLSDDHSFSSLVDFSAESEAEQENKEAEEKSKKEAKIHISYGQVYYSFIETKTSERFAFLMQSSIPLIDVQTPPPELEVS